LKSDCLSPLPLFFFYSYDDHRDVQSFPTRRSSDLEYKLKLEVDDRIILLTDGVTECKRGDRFVTKQEVIEVIEQFSHLSEQEQVEKVYAYFDEMDDFQLKDDFTLLVIRRVV